MDAANKAKYSRLSQQIFSVADNKAFERLCIEVFRLQATHVPIYRNYIRTLNVVPEDVTNIADIPFLPIQFFKSHRVIADSFDSELTFLSSGTGGAQSTHYVASSQLYLESMLGSFRHRWGEAEDYCFLCLLPSYIERGNSSLVWMCDQLIRQSPFEESGFYLDQLDDLGETIRKLESREIPTLLIGVTFALLDLAERGDLELKSTTIVETGGMKGRGEELTRAELHRKLQSSFGSKPIQSEYGMTELLSQAYTLENGKFACPPWMKIRIRDVRDPFAQTRTGKTGGIDVIDLANLDSCSFISTQDLGRIDSSGHFEVMGRFDNSDLRGCSLLVVDS